MLQTIWGWQPALYLFLGGMGSGAFVTAAVLYLRNKQRYEKAVCLSMWAAVACLVIGLLLLLSELTNPLRGMMMWQSFSHFTSWMTIGAWGLAAAVVVFGVAALLASARWRAKITAAKGDAAKGTDSPDSKIKKMEGPLSVLSIIGIVLGIFVAAYTGILLMSAPGVPLWNTPILPCLFLVSGMDTGVALVELIGAACRGEDKLDRRSHHGLLLATSLLIVVELVVLAVFFAAATSGDPVSLAAATAADSAALFTSGILAPYFWGLVVVVGLVAPLLIAAASLIVGRKEGKGLPVGLSLLGAVCVLVGGCELRFLMLAGGLHANIMVDTLSSIVLGG